jgi:hypothetical protein
MSIDKIKSVLSKKGGIAPTNRFNVFFTPPGAITLLRSPDKNNVVGGLLSQVGNAVTGNFDKRNLVPDPRDISILCESVTLPGRSLSTMDYQGASQSVKVPYTYIDADVEMTFILTNDYYMRVMFDNWISSIFDTDLYRAGYKNDYAVDVVIQQLNQKNVPVYGVKLENAYPIDMAAINLSNAEESGVQKITVTFAYDRYVPEGTLSTTGSAITAASGG